MAHELSQIQLNRVQIPVYLRVVCFVLLPNFQAWCKFGESTDIIRKFMIMNTNDFI